MRGRSSTPEAAIRRFALAAAVVAIAASASLASAHAAHDADAQPDVTIYLGDLYIRPADGEPGDPVHANVGSLNVIEVINEGAIEHELHFGRNPNLEMRLFEENLFGQGGEHAGHGFLGVVLAPGESVKMHVWIPEDRAGTWELACFIPGHYEAGQKAPLILD